MPLSWWLQKPQYFRFMLREFTAVFLAGYCVFLLVLLWKVKQGSDAYEDFRDRWIQPHYVVLHVLAFVAALYHSITWFNLTPKVMVIRRGEEKVPAALIAGANYVLWLLVSAVILFIVLSQR
jgi:fumarate reductase subunit C